ncbi:hypothetical protein, partial [Mycobacterium marinum]|uniref:hypothetical protein n=1 Tax=Mycobacterium marinum TaxID=1781 RepID=UPI0021C38970
AQARLVQIEVTRDRGSPDFEVEIHNYGDRAIIGAAVVNAWWFGHPEYSWRHSDAERDRLRIVQPERDAPGESVRISFDDAEGNAVPKLLRVDGYGFQHFDEVTIMPDAVVVFMDANGNLWQTGSSLAPRRVDSPPESQ